MTDQTFPHPRRNVRYRFNKMVQGCDMCADWDVIDSGRGWCRRHDEHRRGDSTCEHWQPWDGAFPYGEEVDE